MKKLILYSYTKCSTCRKALKWLDQRGFGYQLIDILKESPSEKHLKLALKKYSLEKKKIFNTRSKSFQLLNFDINSLSNQEIIKILQDDGKLVKRPFLVYEEKNIILGFNEDEYNNHFCED